MPTTKTPHRTAPLAALALLLALLPGCSDPVEAVRQTRLEAAPTRTVAEGLEGYPYFTRVSWSSFKDKDGKTIVQAECDIDVAAACRDQQGLALAIRDVARDAFVAQFVVAGWPPTVRPQWASHVTVCADGKRLVFADPKYLGVILRGERVRQFCLEGLNCPGTRAPAPGGEARQPAPPPGPWPRP